MVAARTADGETALHRAAANAHREACSVLLGLTDLPMVGSAYSYLQEWLPNVAQAVVREGWVDSVGIGRLVLSYPDLLADTLETGEIKQPKLICRTFSDCTTAPRNGIISGCYPLDDLYKNIPENEQLKDAKKALREKLKVINQGE